MKFSWSAKKSTEWSIKGGSQHRSGKRRSERSGTSTDFVSAVTQVFNVIKEEAAKRSDPQPPAEPEAHEPEAHEAPPAPASEPAEDDSSPASTSSVCADALAAIDLGDRTVIPVVVDGIEAVAIQLVEGDDQMAWWTRVRSAMRPSGCYPVLLDADTFEYLPESSNASSGQATDDRMSQLRAALFAKNPHSISRPIIESFVCYSTETRFGSGPTEQEVEGWAVETDDELEDRLFAWERSTFGDEHVISQGETEVRSWYEVPSTQTILLIVPVATGSEAMRFLDFHPIGGRPQWHLPLCNDLAAWERDFGAELVANYFTMLQFVVARPPTDLTTSYQLAAEHDVVGNATLAPAGITRRHYAADLVGRTRWHLHDRP